MTPLIIALAGITTGQIHGKAPYCVDLGPIVSCEYRTPKACFAASKALTGRNYCVKLEARPLAAEENK